MPTLYVKKKRLKSRFCQRKENKFLGPSSVLLLDFLFQDLGILSRISLNQNWTLKLSQKVSELILNSFFFLLGM